MFTEIHPCKKCGAPPKSRWVADKDDVWCCQDYCPVCDIPSALPYRWHRRMVWLGDHVPVVTVRFRHAWFGGQRYHQIRERLRRPRKAPEPLRLDQTWAETWAQARSAPEREA